MAQPVNMDTALGKDKSSVPSTQVRELTTAYDLSSRSSDKPL